MPLNAPWKSYYKIIFTAHILFNLHIVKERHSQLRENNEVHTKLILRHYIQTKLGNVKLRESTIIWDQDLLQIFRKLYIVSSNIYLGEKMMNVKLSKQLQIKRK